MNTLDRNTLGETLKRAVVAIESNTDTLGRVQPRRAFARFDSLLLFLHRQSTHLCVCDVWRVLQRRPRHWRQSHRSSIDLAAKTYNAYFNPFVYDHFFGSSDLLLSCSLTMNRQTKTAYIANGAAVSNSVQPVHLRCGRNATERERRRRSTQRTRNHKRRRRRHRAFELRSRCRTLTQTRFSLVVSAVVRVDRSDGRSCFAVCATVERRCVGTSIRCIAAFV
jgi:hypothetical protein